MSYEGYSLNLCAFGHRVWADDDNPLAAPICEICGQPIVWTYEVDTTNNSGVEPVLVPFLVHGDASRFYLPSNAGQIDLAGLDHRIQPEMRPVMFLDCDHPDDGPFVTERAARENKAGYWQRARKQNAKEERVRAKRAMRGGSRR